MNEHGECLSDDIIEALKLGWPNPPINKLEQSCFDEGMSFEEYIDWIGEQSR